MLSVVQENSVKPRWIDPYNYKRRKTREVMVGKVGVGGLNPIRVQSMTTTDTLNVEATITQSIRMVEAGCEIVRITAPTVNDARALGKIKEGLFKRGIDAPLVADIHFAPQAAMESAEYVEKVRINPGNFVDTKRFAVKEYTDEQYAAELERIEAAFTPLVEKLKRLKRAVRIGTNHGSLSDRIMNRYGDSPLGMVESALEYVRICEKNGYHDIILSMKSSNPKVMIQAYRLLAARMDELGMDYPFHLGVTEAGGGEDGRIKSAIGIGSLLEDGIGDTIRVSLTEDPEFEIPVCWALARRFQPENHPQETSRAVALTSQKPHSHVISGSRDDVTGKVRSSAYCPDPFSYARRKSKVFSIGPFLAGSPQLVRVITRVPQDATAESLLAFFEEQLNAAKGQDPEIFEWTIHTPEDLKKLQGMRSTLAHETSRLAFLGRFEGIVPTPQNLKSVDLVAWISAEPVAGSLLEAFLQAVKTRGIPVLVEAETSEEAFKFERAASRSGVPTLLSLSSSDTGALLKEYRLLAARLAEAASRALIHIKTPSQKNSEDQVLQPSILIGSLLCDGIGDSVQVDFGDTLLNSADLRGQVEPTRPQTTPELSNVSPKLRRNLELVYNILQAAGVRITKTEFVSCPSCGRTLFDLQSTTERIKSKTGHLKGVKIAIMGCIVNGPGEMADADFGYVGGAPEKINLYVGKECVQKGIPTEVADQALIDLIKAHGKWVDPT